MRSPLGRIAVPGAVRPRFATARAFRKGPAIYLRLRSGRRLALGIVGLTGSGRRVRGTVRRIRTRPGRLVRLRFTDPARRIKTLRITRPLATGGTEELGVRVR